MNPSKAVIIGTGPLGRHTARALQAEGWQTSFIARSVHAGLPGGASSVAIDARDPQALTAATQGAALIIHAANVPYQLWEKDLPALQAAAIQAARTNRAVLACTDNLYGYDPRAQPFTETSSTDAPSRKGRLRNRLFAELMAAHRIGDIRAVTVRGSDYFGPEADWQAHFGSRFITPLLAGKRPSLIGRQDARHSFTYLPDFGRALALAGTRETAWGRTWHAPTAPAITIADFAALHFAAVGRAGDRAGSLGRGMLGLVGLFNPVVREMGEVLYQFDHDFVVDSGDFERVFGVQPTPIPLAVDQSIAWYRKLPKA